MIRKSIIDVEDIRKTAYFFLLERLRKEGYFDNFNQADFDALVNKSNEYFDKFKENFNKYNELSKKITRGNVVNIISKHHFSFLDFNEEVGTRKISAENDSESTILTKFEVKMKSTDYSEFLKEDDNFPFNFSFKELGVELGDSNSLMDLMQNTQKILEGVFISTIIGRVEFQEQLNTMISKAKSYFNSNKQVQLQLSNSLNFRLNKQRLYELSKEINIILAEDIRKSFLVEKKAPVFINNTALVADFIDRENLEMLTTVHLVKLIRDNISDSYIRATGETSAKQDFMKACDNELNKNITDIIKSAITMLSKSYSNKILSAINSIQGGNMSTPINMLMDLMSVANQEVFKKVKKDKKGIVLSLNTVGVGKKIKTIPMYENKEVTYSEIEITKEVLNKNDFTEIIDLPISPNKIRYEVDFKRKKSTLEVISFIEKVELAYSRNDTMNPYLIGKGHIIEGGYKQIAFDEADKGAEGKNAKVSRNVARNADNVTISSGTPVAGEAHQIVPQLAFSGNMSSADVEINKVEFAKQCGLSEINSKTLAKIMFGIETNIEVRTLVSELYDSYEKMKRNKSATNIVNSIIKESLEKKLIPKMIMLGIGDMEEFENVEFTTEVDTLSSLFYGMYRLDNETKGALEFKTLAEGALVDSYLLMKKRPGMNNPKTFVGLIKSIGSQNSSIMARSTLHGKPEELLITDLKNYSSNFPKGGNWRETYNKEKFIKNNRTGIRLVQGAINKYSSDKFLENVMSYLKKNFKFFIENFEGGKKKEHIKALIILTKHINLELDREYTPDVLATIIGKSTKSGKDSFLDIYSDYIKTNSDLLSLRKYTKGSTEKTTLTKEKIKVFMELMRIFDFFLKDGIKILAKKGECIIPLSDGILLDLSHSESLNIFAYETPSKKLLVKDFVSKIKLGYPRGYVFSTKIDLCPHELKYLLKKDKEGFYIPYTLDIKNREENSVFDALASKGIAKEVKDTIKSEEGAIVSSVRTIGTVINFLTSVHEAIKARTKTEGKTIEIILNMPAVGAEGTSFRDILIRLDKKRVAKNRIIINPTPRPSLDSEVAKSVQSNHLTIVISNYESASRGLDLSKLSKIIATGRMVKGKDMVQFLSRLYSLKKQDAKISLFNGGDDAILVAGDKKGSQKILDFVFPEYDVKDEAQLGLLLGERISNLVAMESDGTEGEKKSIELIRALGTEVAFFPTKTNKESEQSIDKLMVYNGFMTGKNTSMESILGRNSKERVPIFIPSLAFKAKGEVNKNEVSIGFNKR